MIGTLGAAKMVDVGLGEFPPTPPHALIWDGGGADDNWMTNENWEGDVAPTGSGDEDIVFSGAVRLTPNNNFPGNNTQFRSISFSSTAGAFTLNGNGVKISKTLASYSGGNQTVNLSSIGITDKIEVITNGDMLVKSPMAVGAGGLTKSSGGTLTIGSTCTYTGKTTIESGKLTIGDGANDGDISSSSEIINNSELEFNSVVGGKFYNNVISGNGELIKSGVSDFTLGGVNIYTGNTSITAGTLFVNGEIGPASIVTVDAGAKLGGTGTIHGTTNNNGIILPGTGGSTIGTLTMFDTTFDGAQTGYTVDLNGTTPTFDQINSTGTVTCEGTLTVNSNANPEAGKVYTIVEAVSVAGIFDGLPDGTQFMTLLGRGFIINYTATQVTLTDATLGQFAVITVGPKGPAVGIQTAESQPMIESLYGAKKIYATCPIVNFTNGVPLKCDAKTFVKFDNTDWVQVNQVSYTFTPGPFSGASATIVVEELPTPYDCSASYELKGVKFVVENPDSKLIDFDNSTVYLIAAPGMTNTGFEYEWAGPSTSGSGYVVENNACNVGINGALNVISTCPSILIEDTTTFVTKTELKFDSELTGTLANEINVYRPDSNNLTIGPTPVSIDCSDKDNLKEVKAIGNDLSGNNKGIELGGSIFVVGTRAPLINLGAAT